MNLHLVFASLLIFLLALAHSVLGEIKIFRRFKDVQGLPPFSGIPLFRKREKATEQTLRMVWHVATLLGCGFSAVLAFLSCQVIFNEGEVQIIQVISITMFSCSLTALCMSKGNHSAWIIFLIIGVLCLLGIS